MPTYAIIGGGSGNDKVIAASLRDLPAKSTFYVPWEGSPSPAMETVYDWLIDNESKFIIVGDRVPRSLSKYAEDVIETDRDPVAAVLQQAAIDKATTALVLYDEENDEWMHNLLLSVPPSISKMLELTNGLAPIFLEDEDTALEEEIQSVPAPLSEEDRGAYTEEMTEEFSKEQYPDTPEEDEFTRDELESMPVAALKRQARAKGIPFSNKAKAELVEAILNGAGTPQPVVEVEVPVTVEVSHDGTATEDMVEYFLTKQHIERLQAKLEELEKRITAAIL